jgi:cytochrome c biogenesis protein CcmG, thiol:disulfide interchange protein DsbE
MPAPPVIGTSFTGQHIDLSSYRGRVVLLDFWASWCTPCLEEMPTLVEWQKQLQPSGLQIVGISLDDDAAPARKIAARYHLNYPVLMGTPQMADQYKILGLPELVLIGRDGRIAGVDTGEVSTAKLREAIERLLRADPGTH